jgi:hypothetical protein
LVTVCCTALAHQAEQGPEDARGHPAGQPPRGIPAARTGAAAAIALRVAARPWRCTSNVESEVHDIALLDDVLLAFETQLARIPRT